MTAAELAIDCYEGFLSTHTDRGVSDEAEEIRSRVEHILGDLLKSLSLGESYRETLSALYDIADQCSVANWDGYDAVQVSPMAVAQAFRLLRTLPSTLRTPDLSADPDGEISFEWYLEPRRVFSISVGPHGELSYAGLFGRSDAHGTEYLGDELPKAIMDNLSRLFSRRY
jgi:hypothetical protein